MRYVVVPQAALSTWTMMIYIKQEAMENFVFPDEIKTKMMKIDKIEMGEKRNLKKNISKRSKFCVKSRYAGKFPLKAALNMC